MNLSEPISLDLEPRKWVYRLWAGNGDCLYVGQHKGFHPMTRIKAHRGQPWWDEVARIDSTEVLDGDLDVAERQQIHDLGALYNDGGWRRLHPSPEAAAATAQPNVDEHQMDAGPRTAEQLKHRLAQVEGTLAQLEQCVNQLDVDMQNMLKRVKVAP
jgi:hypothetical protein